MAHFAELDENNTVLRVIVVSNEMIVDENNIEQEKIGVSYCKSLLGGRWIQTSYNTILNTHTLDGIALRKNYAGIGYIYDKNKDAFIPPKPDGDGFILDENTCTWIDTLYQPLLIGVSRV